jgi:hypothetical protein
LVLEFCKNYDDDDFDIEACMTSFMEYFNTAQKKKKRKRSANDDTSSSGEHYLQSLEDVALRPKLAKIGIPTTSEQCLWAFYNHPGTLLKIKFSAHTYPAREPPHRLQHKTTIYI